MANRVLLLACLLLVWVLSSVAAASTAATTRPRAFEASYHLSISGWPDADILHRLTQMGVDDWRITMRARIAIARGQEAGYFRLDGDELRSVGYNASYRLLGIKRRYALDSSDLESLPDRQSAIVALAMRAANSSCQQGCPIHYRDHRGRNKTLVYRLLPKSPLQVAGQTLQALRLELGEPDEPDKRMVMALHPELPGLLLEVDYYSDGKRKSRLALTSLTLY
ncbi:MAG TPA: hypothetical protein VK991_12240 [Halomonas sp.]|nr:hypothetical protein [Halomonas sp.]